MIPIRINLREFSARTESHNLQLGNTADVLTCNLFHVTAYKIRISAHFISYILPVTDCLVMFDQFDHCPGVWSMEWTHCEADTQYSDRYLSLLQPLHSSIICSLSPAPHPRPHRQ